MTRAFSAGSVVPEVSSPSDKLKPKRKSIVHQMVAEVETEMHPEEEERMGGVPSISILSRHPDLSRKPPETPVKRIRLLERTMVDQISPGINPYGLSALPGRPGSQASGS